MARGVGQPPESRDRIAHVAHDALRTWRLVSGGPSLPLWDRSPKHRALASALVEHALSAGSTPESIHALRVEAGTASAPWSEAPDSERKESALIHAVATTLGCGVERWDVKTLTDAAAASVNLTPKPATIAELIAFPAPLADPPARLDSECQVYEVQGTITLAKQEADSDIHMVLDDGQGHTMIIEAACPGCAAGSLALSQITAVRQVVETKFPEAFQGQVLRGLSVPVIATGVLFLDRIHGQSGVAPNGVELHPLLDLVLR